MKRTTLRARLAGMSMVELMVAMVIGLLGVIVIFQVFALNEGVRRSTTSGSDEQTRCSTRCARRPTSPTSR
jgi:type IV pilus assembly protein PilW